MPDFQFQPFELVFDAPLQSGPAQARGEFSLNGQKVVADLCEIEGFLFFNFQNGDPQANFLVGAMHTAISNPPRRAFEKLGRAQTLILLLRRALNLGFWGRLFVLNDPNGARWMVFLGANGRNLLASWRDHARSPRAEWTPFEWDLTPDLVETPASQLCQIVENQWENPDSRLNRVKAWGESDYFERLWQSLRFERGDSPLLRGILRDAASLICPDDGARGWILRFQLPERGAQIDLYEQLFEERGARQFPLSALIYAALGEILAEFAPRRMRAREAEFLAQREWLEGNSGVGNWSLSIEARALSAHERLETALRLRRNLQSLGGVERGERWLAPFLKSFE